MKMNQEMLINKDNASSAAKAGAAMIDSVSAKNVDWEAVIVELQAAVKYAKRAAALYRREFN